MQIHLRGFLYFTFSIAALSACKKNTNELVAPVTNTPPADTVTIASAANKIKDSSVMFARDIYLWNTQIPSDFNGRNHADPAAIMTAIRPYSVETGFSQPVDRWSFAMKKTEWDKLSGGVSTLSGSANEAGDFGLSVFFKAEGDLRVRLVEPASPAGIAGIKRGWRITAINGSTNMTTSNATTIVDNVYNASSGTFTFTTPEGSSITRQLSAAHYTEKPVYLDTTYNINGSRIGYLVYNSFLGNTTQVSSQLQQVFNRFSAQQVTDVVIDLRYNGGGYVSLAEQMSNYLVPNSANGAVMMKQVYNSQNTQNNKTSYFKKSGSININNIYFIVSKSSASASELLINNLKPVMNVKLIGPSATHGKPVGFFPIPVGDWYVFPVSFKTINKNGEGNYYSGLPVNAQVADGLDKDWGDVTESCLASAIRNISTGGYFRPQQEETYTPAPEIARGNSVLDEPFLKVTVDKR